MGHTRKESTYINLADCALCCACFLGGLVVGAFIPTRRWASRKPGLECFQTIRAVQHDPGHQSHLNIFHSWGHKMQGDMTDAQKAHSFLLAPAVVLTWVEIKLSPLFKVQTAVRQGPVAQREIGWPGVFIRKALSQICVPPRVYYMCIRTALWLNYMSQFRIIKRFRYCK